MNQKEDLFGCAVLAYAHGDRTPFYIQTADGKLNKHNLKRYFRKAPDLNKTDQRIISLSYGDILDVGCATANYFPALMKRGTVYGIDISKELIQVAKENGINNCHVGNIFSFNTSKKFNTITLLENNLGMAGDINRTKKLLKIFSNLLKEKGQILTTLSNRAKRQDYLETELTPVWRNKKGETFKWVNFNVHFLSKLCDETDLKLFVLSGNRYNRLVRITKK